jgi:hypothetical protein
MTITLREQKGSELTYAELDGNFSDLDTRTHLGWRDNVVPLTLRGGITEPPMQLFKDSIYLLAFSQSQMQEAYAVFHIDHDYALGTAIYPHIHWSVNDSSVGTVRWGFEYSIAKGHQQQAFGNSVTKYIEQPTTGVPYMHYVAELADSDAIPGTGIEPDTLIIMRIFRDASHSNDTLDAQSFGICVDLHYQANRSSTPNKRPNFYG